MEVCAARENSESGRPSGPHAGLSVSCFLCARTCLPAVGMQEVIVLVTVARRDTCGASSSRPLFPFAFSLFCFLSPDVFCGSLFDFFFFFCSHFSHFSSCFNMWPPEPESRFNFAYSLRPPQYFVARSEYMSPNSKPFDPRCLFTFHRMSRPLSAQK